MMIAAPLGYLVAAFFALMGGTQAYCYMEKATEDMPRELFITGLTLSLWPVALAMVLVLLTQIGSQLDKLRGVMSMVAATQAVANRHNPHGNGSAANATAVAAEVPRAIPVTEEPLPPVRTAQAVPVRVPRHTPATANTPPPRPEAKETKEPETLRFFKID